MDTWILQGKSNMTDEQLRTIENVLTMLAKQKCPDCKWWIERVRRRAERQVKIDIVCRICDMPIDGQALDHGLNHLKERNLLPFV